MQRTAMLAQPVGAIFQEPGTRTCPKVEGAHLQGDPGQEGPKVIPLFVSPRLGGQIHGFHSGRRVYPAKMGAVAIGTCDAKDTWQHSFSHGHPLLVLFVGLSPCAATHSEQLSGGGGGLQQDRRPRQAETAPSSKVGFPRKCASWHQDTEAEWGGRRRGGHRTRARTASSRSEARQYGP